MQIGRDEDRITGENLPEALIEEELQQLKKDRVIERIWEHDHTVWKDSAGEISNRLGWLHAPSLMEECLESIYEFVDQVLAGGFKQVLLLGMGGSSLAVEVFRNSFGVKNGYPDLEVLDSTDPGAVLDKERQLDYSKTLFIVSTKSGSTVETISLMNYFYNRATTAVGKEKSGNHFTAITDPGSSLEKTAEELGFRKIFLNDPHIGGRYSALSYFGLVPAALIGVDLRRLLSSARSMAATAKPSSSPLINANTPAWLGTALGVLGGRGRDKVTLVLSPGVSSFGTWVEQLIAESTGKEGKGLLPVTGETLTEPQFYAHDRLFVYVRLAGDSSIDQKVHRLKEAGHPVIRLNLEDQYALGGEFFRWMMATSVAGRVMGINPFDQPDVESAKDLARKMVATYRDRGELPALVPDLTIEGLEICCGCRAENLQQLWHQFIGQANPGDNEGEGRSYIAIQAYIKPDPETDRLMQILRSKIQTSSRMAVTTGYGPRFLHSTGQLHKGDAGNGLFVQITAENREDLPIPDRPGSELSSLSFGLLKDAQALGDYRALLDAGRKVMRIHFTRDIHTAIEKLTDAL